jgi:hypothetical protein
MRHGARRGTPHATLRQNFSRHNVCDLATLQHELAELDNAPGSSLFKVPVSINKMPEREICNPWAA